MTSTRYCKKDASISPLFIHHFPVTHRVSPLLYLNINNTMICSCPWHSVHSAIVSYGSSMVFVRFICNSISKYVSTSWRLWLSKRALACKLFHWAKKRCTNANACDKSNWKRNESIIMSHCPYVYTYPVYFGPAFYPWPSNFLPNVWRHDWCNMWPWLRLPLPR